VKAQVKVSPQIIVEVEGETQKDLFKAIASATEVFGEKCCGLCASTRIVHAYRVVTQGKKVFEYPEYHCQDCFARLSIGCLFENGGLFPHRKLDKDGKPSRKEGSSFGPHRGWTKFKGNVEPEDSKE
jgi:hypothetical protein